MKQCLYCDKSNNVVGYCELHKCYVTKKQMDCKHCLEKGCYHFKKNEAHPYWAYKELKKERRKKRKLEQNKYFELIQSRKGI